MEQLLKEILESYEMIKKNKYGFTIDKGKGTKKYTLDRISVLRSQLLEIQKDIMSGGRHDS